MSDPEILPAGADPTQYKLRKSWTPARGDDKTESWTGPRQELEDMYEQARANPNVLAHLSALTLEHSAGKGTFTHVFATLPDPNYKGIQELLGVDVKRALYRATYWDALPADEVLEVRKAFEDQADPDPAWNLLQDRLYGHLINGQEQYLETAYIFRQTFRSNSIDIIRKSASNPNTVQPLPELSQEMEALIDALPAGEWLKRPTKVRYLGKEGFDVSLEFQWAPEWSVIYGGSFSGLPLT